METRGEKGKSSPKHDGHKSRGPGTGPRPGERDEQLDSYSVAVGGKILPTLRTTENLYSKPKKGVNGRPETKEDTMLTTWPGL